MRRVTLPDPSRGRRAPASGFLRSLAASSAAHGGLLGAGVLLGVVFAGGGRAPAPRAYVARFELAAEAPPVESGEEFEVTEVRADLPEPELSSSEVWGHSTPLVEEPRVEPPAPRSTDWLAEPPFLTGELRRSVPAEVSSATLPSPARVPAEQAEEPRPPAPRVEEPVALHRPAPSYPRLARRAGEEGSVVCRLYLSPQGSVERVEIVESSGSTRLDEAAREALLGWRFEPRREDGRAVSGTHLHRVTFRLDS